MEQSDCPGVVGRFALVTDGSMTVGMVEGEVLTLEKTVFAGQDREKGVWWVKVRVNGQKRYGRVMSDERV